MKKIYVLRGTRNSSRFDTCSPILQKWILDQQGEIFGVKTIDPLGSNSMNEKYHGT